MKRILSLVLALLAAVSLLAACDVPAALQNPEKQILGQWDADGSRFKFQTLEFKSDGTVGLGLPLVAVAVQGKYTIKKGSGDEPALLSITYNLLLVDTTVDYNVTFKDDKLIVRTVGTSTDYYYTRVS
ncbi:MAG: hypothetical protein LBR73_03185 [Oscillospiraceae bacterium]|jgi:hypothetical protein|nr:hypothetical protein [Oscillospiraceae bacterium]